MSEQMLNEAINNIPISTRKRRLFDNKPPPLTDSSNIPSVSIINILNRVECNNNF